MTSKTKVKIASTRVNTPLILEIFAGTGSVGKVANKRGFNVISIDIDPKFKPDIVANILELQYKDLPTPNFIWASVPCNTFSWLICSGKTPSRDCKTHKALTDVGRTGDKILNKTLEIIRYFSNLNKNLKWVIENPRGMMREQPAMKPFDLATTSYCMYGDKRNKPTDFFNNFNLELKPVCKPSAPHGSNANHVGVVDVSLHERYKIPPKLIDVIFNQAFMAGAGVMDFIKNPFGWIKKRTLDGRPRILNDLLVKEGEQTITKLEVCRSPVLGVFQKAINVMTFGMFKRQMKKLNYDTMFHLYLVVHLANGNVYSLEKNQRVNVIKGKKEGECQSLAYGAENLNEFVVKAEEKKIPGFYRYDAFKDNCQKWVYDLLNSNGITRFNEFVLQPAETLAPGIFKKFARGITDIAGVADYVVRGGQWDV